MNLPSGTITFLFTDVEGSTRLWEQYPDTMPASLQAHDTLMRRALEAHNGYVFKTVGDAFCAAFATPQDAIHAAVSAQSALSSYAMGRHRPACASAWLSTPARLRSGTTTTLVRR